MILEAEAATFWVKRIWYVSRLRCTRAIHTYTNHTEHIQNRHPITAGLFISCHFLSLLPLFHHHVNHSTIPPPPELQVNSDPKTHRLLDVSIIIFISIIILLLLLFVHLFPPLPLFPFRLVFWPRALDVPESRITPAPSSLPFLHLSHRLSLSLSISSFLAQLGEDEITGVASPSILITLWLVPLDPINSLHRHLA